jgi:hypothetical protein
LTSDQWIGVHTGGAHYLDHLGILCQGLRVPLFVTEEKTFEAAKQFYPQLHVEYVQLRDLSLEFLAEKADVIFESGHTFATELVPLWELLYGKKMRVVYCPHGNSDKMSPKLRKDLSLVYGDHMKNHLTRTGEGALLEKMVVTGNYRASYDQAWYDAKLEERLGTLPSKKTVFYAPSWESDSWFSEALKVIQEVGSRFNLLMRLHPFLEDQFPAETDQLKDLGAIDLSPFPCIYPILRRADYYVGDCSSIGYDFLTMNRPLFFLGRYEGDIYECGITLDKNRHYGDAIASFQDTSTFRAKRKKLVKSVFGKERSFEAIRAEIKRALSFDRAPWITIERS